MVQNLSFNTKFAREHHLQGNKLKITIDNFHFLAPGTTKTIKSKIVNDIDEINEDLDDGLQLYVNRLNF